MRSKLQVELRMTCNNTWVVMGLKDKSLKEVFIPDKVDGYDVRSIADNAFANNHNITYVNLPNTINFIGENAFYNCINLNRVYRYHSHYDEVTIKKRAFFGCEKLSTIYLNNIFELGKEVFAGCSSLEEFPFDSLEHLKVIQQGTFAKTKIHSVTLYSQQVCKDAFLYTPVEEVFIKGNPKLAADFIKRLKNAQVYVPPKSPFLDLGFHGIHVEERTKLK